MSTVTLFHGTTHAGAKGIEADGYICGRAYFTPRRDIAENYCCDVVVEVQIDLDMLNKDLDTEDDTGESMEEWVERGCSVFVAGDVDVSRAKFHHHD